MPRRATLLQSLALAAFLVQPAFGFEVHKGVGLHEWMNWSPLEADGSYRWPPYQSVEQWLTRYRPLTDWPAADPVARIRAVGFDFVRLTIDPGPLLDSSGPRRDEAIAVIREAASKLIGANLSVVVNLHSISQVPKYGKDVMIAGADSPEIAWYRQMVVDLTRGLLPLGTEKLAIEPFNEPTLYPCEAPQQADWQKVMETQVAAIRAVSQQITIVATGLCAGGVDGLVALKPTFDDPNILYSFHMYEPHVFTHQQPPTEGDYGSGLPWPNGGSTAEQAIAGLRDAMSAAGVPELEQYRQIGAVLPAVQEYFAETWDEARLAARIGEAIAWGDRNRIPTSRLFMGEFGVIVQSADKKIGAPEADRSRYIRTARTIAEAHGIPWSVWEYSNPFGMTVIVPEGAAVPDRDLLVALGLAQ